MLKKIEENQYSFNDIPCAVDWGSDIVFIIDKQTITLEILKSDPKIQTYIHRENTTEIVEFLNDYVDGMENLFKRKIDRYSLPVRNLKGDDWVYYIDDEISIDFTLDDVGHPYLEIKRDMTNFSGMDYKMNLFLKLKLDSEFGFTFIEKIKEIIEELK